MPHLVIDRIRSPPDFLAAICCCARSKVSSRALCAYTLEALELVGSLIFVVGSVCFLPAYMHNLRMYLLGCVLFVVGAAIMSGVSAYTLSEAIREKGHMNFEALENWLYLIGSVIFLVGTILYWPEQSHYINLEWVKDMSLGAYFNWFSPEFEGTLLFIWGSLLFAMAAFVNGLNQRAFDNTDGQLMAATTSLYMIGSLLFVMGSVGFLPELGCNGYMYALGAWAFMVGSVIYLVGGLISLYRTHRKLNVPDPESIPFLSPLVPSKAPYCREA